MILTALGEEDARADAAFYARWLEEEGGSHGGGGTAPGGLRYTSNPWASLVNTAAAGGAPSRANALVASYTV